MHNDFRHAVNEMKDPVKRRAELAQLLDGLVKAELQDVKTRQAFFDSVVREAAGVGVFASAASKPAAVPAPAA